MANKKYKVIVDNLNVWNSGECISILNTGDIIEIESLMMVDRNNNLQYALLPDGSHVSYTFRDKTFLEVVKKGVKKS